MSSITITTIQTELYWEDKAANLVTLEKKIMGIGKTEIVVLPEMFSTGFSMQPQKFSESMEGETVQWMKTTARKKGIILTGSLIIEDGGHFYNRLVWMLPNGECGWYDKRHLFAFGKEHENYTAGGKRLIASVKGWRINLQVCYDLRFPVWGRQQKSSDELPEFDMVIYVANWPQRRSYAWKQLLIARAIENQCYVIGVNRVGEDGNGIYHGGNSMIIGPLGEILYECIDREDIFTTTLSMETLNKTRAQFPFLKDADEFLIQSTRK